MATITHKRGDTFELTMTLETQGVAVDLTDFTISCQMRDQIDALIQTFTVVKTDPTNGVFTVSATDAETYLWPVANLFTDIEFIALDSTVSSSDTFSIQVTKDITRV
jgi:hypothetical protein